MRVQISLPLPMWGCRPTDEGTRLRTLRSEFNSLHPLQLDKARVLLTHDDASVLTLFGSSGDPGWGPGAGGYRVIASGTAVCARCETVLIDSANSHSGGSGVASRLAESPPELGSADRAT
jgi:hypothetical protein